MFFNQIRQIHDQWTNNKLSKISKQYDFMLQFHCSNIIFNVVNTPIIFGSGSNTPQNHPSKKYKL